jgi:hypothetical protein
MDFSTVNFLAVLVAAISSFIVGSLWYSPILFGKVWQKESGMTNEKIKRSNMVKIFGLTFVLSFIIALCLALFFAGQADFTNGLLYGFFTGAFWVATAIGILYLFEHHSFKLWLINAGYHIIGFTIMGGILGAWH